MPTYTYTPKLWNGVNLEGSPYTGVQFDGGRGPGQGQRFTAIEATLPGKGDRRVREQPTGRQLLMLVAITAGSEANLETLHKDFDPSKGEGFLEFDDGDAVRWRVAAVIEFVDRVEALNFVVSFRTADPIFETSVLDDATEDSKSGAQFTFARTNSGDRRARFSKAELRYDAIRTRDPSKHFATIFSGQLYNRMPRWWVRRPVHIKWGNGNDAGTIWDSGTTVSKTSVSNDLQADVGQGATNISVDNAIGGGLPTGPNFAFIPASGGGALEQIFYLDHATPPNGVLTGCIRGIGGTVDGQKFDNAKVYESHALYDLNDVRVWLNGREVPLAIGGVRGSDTRLWIPNLTMPPGVRFTLAEAMPSDGGTVRIVGGVANLPNRGRMVVATEVIGWTGRSVRDGTLTGIARALFSGEPEATRAAGTVCALMFADVVVAWEYTFGSNGQGVIPNPAPGRTLAERPVINLATSHNGHWEWGTTGDADSSFFTPKNPRRPAQWQPDFENPEADKNEARPHVVSGDGINVLGFTMLKPVQGKISTLRMVMELPQGIAQTADALDWGVLRRRHTRLRVITVDANGTEEEIEDDHSDDEGSSANHVHTPTERLHRVILTAVRAATAGQYTESGEKSIVPAGDSLYWKLVIDNDMICDSVMLKLRENSSGDTIFFSIFLRNDSGGDDNNPQNNQVLARKILSSQPSISTSLTWEKYTWDGGRQVFLPAGTYWLELAPTGGAGTIYLASGPTETNTPLFQQGNATPTIYEGLTPLFQLIHPGGGPVNKGINAWDNISDPGDTQFRDFEIDLDIASGAEQTPHCRLNANPNTPSANDFTHVTGELKNTTNGEAVDFDAFLDVATAVKNFIRVDFVNGTVRLVDSSSGFEQERAGMMIAQGDVSDPLRLEPGVNNFEYNETQMANVDLELEFRSARE